MREHQKRVVIPAIREAGYTDLAEKLAVCGEYVRVLRCGRCGARHFGGYVRCKDRFCVVCEHARAVIYVARIYERMRMYPDLKWSLLTLTLRDMEDLGSMVWRIKNGWRVLTNTSKVWRQKWRDRMQGYVCTMEVKRGSRSGKWHVHMHVLVGQAEFGRDYGWLKEAWKEITGGDGSVDIRGVKNALKGALEVSKYCFKPGEYVPGDYGALIWNLRGVRRVSTGGVMRHLGRVVERDMDEVDEKQLGQFVCQLCGFDQATLESIRYELLRDSILLDVPESQWAIGVVDRHEGCELV